jgi:hypothetical protein
MNKNTSQGEINHSYSPVPPACYQMTMLVGFAESCVGRIRRYSLSISFHRGSLCSYITGV